MWDKNKYTQYLYGTRKGDGAVNESLKTLDNFYNSMREYKETTPDSTIYNAVKTYFAKYERGHFNIAETTVIKYLTEYSEYVKSNPGDETAMEIAQTISEWRSNRYNRLAVDFVKGRKTLIVPILNNVVIEPKLLNGLDNEDFVSAFRELQNIIISIYNEIETNPNAPMEWGFPDYEQHEGYYHRIPDVLLGLARNGIYCDGMLSIDTKAFAADNDVKRHRKQNTVIDGLRNYGFVLEGYSKKNRNFEITYPDNPNVIFVLDVYGKAHQAYGFKWLTDHAHPRHWSISKHKYGFSYRYVEDKSAQAYEIPFLIEYDRFSDVDKESLLYIRSEAVKNGYKLDMDMPICPHFSCLSYVDGNKKFMMVGERQYKENGTIAAKVNFFKTFTAEKEKMDSIIARFPETFISTCGFCFHKGGNCKSRMKFEVNGEKRFSCSYPHFWLENMTLADIKNVLEMFKVENEI